MGCVSGCGGVGVGEGIALASRPRTRQYWCIARHDGLGDYVEVKDLPGMGGTSAKPSFRGITIAWTLLAVLALSLFRPGDIFAVPYGSIF